MQVPTNGLGNRVEGKGQWGQFENPMGFFAEAGDEGL